MDQYKLQMVGQLKSQKWYPAKYDLTSCLKLWMRSCYHAFIYQLNLKLQQDSGRLSIEPGNRGNGQLGSVKCDKTCNIRGSLLSQTIMKLTKIASCGLWCCFVSSFLIFSLKNLIVRLTISFIIPVFSLSDISHTDLCLCCLAGQKQSI